MAHFYGIIKGNGQTKSTRCGTKKTGIKTTIASWDGAIQVNMWWDSINEINKYEITEIPWHGSGKTNTIQSGIIGQSDEE